ncbi:MAG: metallophosphoesterase [Lachnospiraceae bacterium]|nr:metallophosphoesterase [Lachnospiraceae bacterium]
MKIQTIMTIIGAMIAAVGAVVVWDTHRFVVRSYHISSPKLNKKMRFVVLADLHGRSFGKENQKLLDKIAELKPDGIMIAGDMITAKPGRDFTNSIAFIRRLAEHYPVYYGSGNHEYRMGIYPEKYGDMSKEYETAIAGKNLIRLHTDSVVLEESNICVSGLEIDREFYKKWKAPAMDGNYIKEKLGEYDRERFQILIAHNPAYFPAYAEYGADLVLSGHVHGGIAKLPLLGGVISPALRLFPKYDGGRFEENESVMILSRGLGTHTIPVRFLNPGELVEIVLEPEQ